MSIRSKSLPRFRFTGHDLLVYHISWIPPSDCSWKLNFAGFVADCESGIAGVGFILRDENAIFKAGCAEPVNECDNIVTAELLALTHGLEVAMNQGIDFIEIEGDCVPLLELLYCQAEPMSSYAQELLDQCIDFIKSFRGVNIRRINSYSNGAANKMAALAISEDEPIFWFGQPPPEISEILVEDVIGRWVQVPKV
ncbi:Ribonuclease H-like domain containing protein [Parasponia andersonii]|uniref:Ribonuclease H-like domain containing protein n=1 Tax=Parasponia andersonii TaxID=3476 RepID=A0A2P5AQB3_PARAD|nr:Ribonuclease H-like domain containing protein [Parasponia andersonii]